MGKLLTLFIFLLLILPIISAVEVDMKKEFSQGETLTAKVSGNFLEPILEENIFFYRGHVRIPIEYSISEIDDDFYIYALLADKLPSNYSIVIKDVQYMKGSQVSDEEISKNFTITNATADFSVNPGFIITEEDFFIEVQNLQDYEITIQIDINKSEGVEGFFASLFKGSSIEGQNSIKLKSGEIGKINFELGSTTTFRFVSLSTENLTYEIPVYAFVAETTQEEQEEETEEQTQEETITQEDEEKQITSATTKTCGELEGKTCNYDNETCDGEIKYAKDSKCCLGTCKEIKKSPAGKIIGWLIVIIVLVFVIWFFKKKYRGAKKDINLLEIAKGKKKTVKKEKEK